MRTIWKFVLSLQGGWYSIPKGAEILHVREQGGEVCFWAQVDSKAPAVERGFAVYGTGHDLHHAAVAGKYVGSAHCGAFVWHVFDLGESGK